MKSITVTEEDIKLSRKLIEETNIRSTNYPTVLAAKRSFPEREIKWANGYDDKLLIDGVFHNVYGKYCDISVFLNRFDLGRKVYPFTLEIDIDE